jgi:hypothetical protein
MGLGKQAKTLSKGQVDATRSRVSFFMNKFRKLGFISYKRQESRP